MIYVFNFYGSTKASSKLCTPVCVSVGTRCGAVGHGCTHMNYNVCWCMWAELTLFRTTCTISNCMRCSKRPSPPGVSRDQKSSHQSSVLHGRPDFCRCLFFLLQHFCTSWHNWFAPPAIRKEYLISEFTTCNLCFNKNLQTLCLPSIAHNSTLQM